MHCSLFYRRAPIKRNQSAFIAHFHSFPRYAARAVSQSAHRIITSFIRRTRHRGNCFLLDMTSRTAGTRIFNSSLSILASTGNQGAHDGIVIHRMIVWDGTADGERTNAKGRNKESFTDALSSVNGWRSCRLDLVIWPLAEILAIPSPEYRFIYSCRPTAWRLCMRGWTTLCTVNE